MMIFRPLHTDIPLPKRFTYPFCYEPHPLCIEAASLLQKELADMSLSEGKMFGVLVVTDADGQLGWLAAYSGLLEGRNDWPGFVPPVFDAQQPDGYFKTHEAAISAINQQINDLLHQPDFLAAKAHLEAIRKEADDAITTYKQKMTESKRKRDDIRRQGCEPSADAELIRESQFQKAELKRLKQHYAELLAPYQNTLKQNDEKPTAANRTNNQASDKSAHLYRSVLTQIDCLKEQRRRDSDALQHWLFSQYRMRNAHGEQRDLIDIFSHWEKSTIPPAGSGDCCAPKLLQYAYLHHLHPVCMAEFWWGESPKTELRRHQNYYPACRGKCLPILTFMTQGLEVDPNPHLAEVKQTIPIVYEDEWFMAINKPAGMLSVPGKLPIADVVTALRQQCPDIPILYPVHRLDMATSGLMILAKTTDIHKLLQQQFLQRSVQKCYIALLDGTIDGEGTITLPLRPDPLDRPRQVVDREHGKPAVTYYKAIRQETTGTLVSLYPHTGRTHQLRVHCAHPEGLNCAIKGDTLYGKPASRLYLHAQSIHLIHPITHQEMQITTPLPW